MIGPLLIIIGLYLLWVIFRGRAGAVLNAITGEAGFSQTVDELAAAANPPAFKLFG